MKKQIIITVGREHGSGGHLIAKQLAETLGIEVCDRELLTGTIELSGYSREIVEKMDEKPINFFTSRSVKSYSNSLERNVAEKTFEFLRQKAASGVSFVVVGRCAEWVLRDNPNLLRLFICGNMPDKIARVMEVNHFTEEKATSAIRGIDKKRKAYHNHYCDMKWGDSRGYDLIVNSSCLGIPKTTELLAEFVRAFQEK